MAQHDASSPQPAQGSRPPVLTRGDYKLFAGSFILLAVLVTLLVLLMSTFKQVMARRWLSRPDQLSKLEVRQYVGILTAEVSPARLDAWRLAPDGMPELFAAMALAGEGEEGAARLRADAESGRGERRVAALAGLEYGRPGVLLPRLGTGADGARWAECVEAAALADAYSAVDFVREMDGHFIALFPGKKAIAADVMNGYQRGLNRLFSDPDEPQPLAAMQAFHAGQLREHPELYKSGVLQKIKDSWDRYLADVFAQRDALRAAQAAVLGVVAGTPTLAIEERDTANRFLAGRYPWNAIRLGGLCARPRREAPPGETILREDGASLRGLDLSADGRVRISGGFDHRVRLWMDGEDARIAGEHAAGVMAVALSPDGTRAASAGLDGAIRLWAVASGEPTVTVPANTRCVSALAFSPDGATLAVAGPKGSIRLLDAALGTERAVLQGHSAEVVALAFGAGGEKLYSASFDKTASVWDLTQPGSRPVVLEKHGDGVWTLAVDPNGRWVASGSADRRVMLWDLTGKKPKPRTLKGHKGTVTATAVSADGRRLVSAGADRLVIVWDPLKGRLLGAHPTDVTVNAMRFEPGGDAILMACDDGTVRRWSVRLHDERSFSFGDWVLWLMNKN